MSTVRVEFQESVRVDVGNGLYQSYSPGEIAAFEGSVAQRLLSKGQAKQAPAVAEQERSGLTAPIGMKVAVRFLEGTTVALEDRTVHYAKDEVAGFEPQVAQVLIEQGRAVRMPRLVHPLVEAARSLPDEGIQGLAGALASFPNTIAGLETKAANLRPMLADLERKVAKAQALGQSYDEAAGRETRLDLQEIERQITALAAQEPTLYEDLQRAVLGYLQGAFKATLNEKVRPALRSISETVMKAKPAFDGLKTARETLNDLRQVAMAANIETAALDDAETQALAEFTGDALFSTATLRARLPEDFASLLVALGLYQASMRR